MSFWREPRLKLASTIRTTAGDTDFMTPMVQMAFIKRFLHELSATRHNIILIPGQHFSAHEISPNIAHIQSHMPHHTWFLYVPDLSHDPMKFCSRYQCSKYNEQQWYLLMILHVPDVRWHIATKGAKKSGDVPEQTKHRLITLAHQFGEQVDPLTQEECAAAMKDFACGLLDAPIADGLGPQQWPCILKMKSLQTMQELNAKARESKERARQARMEALSAVKRLEEEDADQDKKDESLKELFQATCQAWLVEKTSAVQSLCNSAGAFLKGQEVPGLWWIGVDWVWSCYIMLDQICFPHLIHSWGILEWIGYDHVKPGITRLYQVCFPHLIHAHEIPWPMHIHANPDIPDPDSSHILQSYASIYA